MKVSFIIVAYNAEKTISGILTDLKNQSYDHSSIEVILVDSNSTDKTRDIMENFKEYNNREFSRVCILENIKKTLPCGWNIALENCTGEIILRVDAHTSIPNDFIEKNVECIKSGENICGGRVVSIADSDNKFQQTLLIAENSALGGGIAKFRRSNKKEYVSTLAFASYKKTVFDRVGRYNEMLARTEDNEMHYRMKKLGYKFCLDPDITSTRFARNSFSKIINQKFLNGYWIGLTLGVEPKCFSLYHFIPFIFVLSIILTLILALLDQMIFFYMLISLYMLANLTLTIVAFINEKFNIYNITLPIIFLSMHISYGIGTLVGIIKIPFWLYKHKRIKRELEYEYK